MNMLSKLSVKSKLLLGFATIIIFTILISVISLKQLFASNDVIVDVNDILGARHARSHNVSTAMIEADAISFALQKTPESYDPAVHDHQYPANGNGSQQVPVDLQTRHFRQIDQKQDQ